MAPRNDNSNNFVPNRGEREQHHYVHLTYYVVYTYVHILKSYRKGRRNIVGIRRELRNEGTKKIPFHEIKIKAILSYEQ